MPFLVQSFVYQQALSIPGPGSTRASMNTPRSHNQKYIKDSNALSHTIKPSSKPFTSFECILIKESVILIVITRFWWSYGVFSRAQTVGMVVGDEDDDDGCQTKMAFPMTWHKSHRNWMNSPLKLCKNNFMVSILTCSRIIPQKEHDSIPCCPKIEYGLVNALCSLWHCTAESGAELDT